jgi:hypothetical protein
MNPAHGDATHDTGTAGLPSEARPDDRLIRARIDREREEARFQARLAERQANARLRREDAEAGNVARDKARQRRATRRATAAAWCAARTVDLLFVPVIGVPALLSWTGMASYGHSEFGPPGLALPALSEGGMWAFAAATTITRRRHPDKPAWHLRLGTLIFAAYGAALNYLHGLGHGGPLTGASMALISVAGVTAHQLITAGPRRSRAEREQAKIDRVVARRERSARRAAVRNARVRLDDSGHAHLVFEPGTAWLSRDRLGRRRLELDDLGPVLNVPPIRDASPVRAEAVQAEPTRIPESVYGPGPVQPTRTDMANAGQTPSQALPGTAREPANGTDAVGTQNDLIGDGDRRDPAVDRNAVVADLADQIRDAVHAGGRWRPDYAQLMAATGRKRSWCEKVVRSARNAVLEVPARTDHDDLTDVMRRRHLTPPIANTTPRP